MTSPIQNLPGSAVSKKKHERGENAEPDVVSLRGLRHDNPLGFMAALGTLRTLDDAEPDAGWEMRWNPDAEIRRSGECRTARGSKNAEDDVVDTLSRHLGAPDPLFRTQYPMAGKNPENVDAYNNFMRIANTLSKEDNQALIRRKLDFAACIVCRNNHAKNPHDYKIVESKFRFVVANTTLFKNAQKLAEVVRNDREIIRRSILEEWDYLDDKTSMDWDPVSLHRTHAKSISDPSGSFNPSMHGANRLAIEALSLYPTINDARGVQTVGWDSNKFTWPIWHEFAGLDEVRGLLAARYDSLSDEELCRIGIELYYSTKVVVNKKFHRCVFTLASRKPRHR